MKPASKNDPQKKRKRVYWLFGLVVAGYIAGVVGYSIWSYNQHKESVFSNIHDQLKTGIFGVEHILQPEPIGTDIDLETISSEKYRESCRRLRSYAKDCGFAAVAAVSRDHDKYRILSCGIVSDSCISTNMEYWSSSILSDMFPRLDMQFDAGQDGTIAIHVDQTEKYGVFHVAVLCRKLAPDSSYVVFAARNMDGVSAMFRDEAFLAISKGAFFLLMAYPLMLLYSITQKKSSQELAVLNEELSKDVEKRKQREAELNDAIKDLERFNAVAIGRETRIMDLKVEINKLLNQQGLPPQYDVACGQNDETEKR